MRMNGLDYAVIGIILLSGIIGLTRGLVREVLSLAAWVAAFWVALTFSQQVAGYLTGYIETETGRHIVAFLALFLGTLIVVALVNSLIVQVVAKTGISGTDMMLGMVFGLARGVFIVAVLMLLASLTKVPQEPWWKESALLKHFVGLAIWARDLLPPDVAKNFQIE